MRVARTFAFADLSGFTDYTGTYGDDAAGRLLSAFRQITREVGSDRGVRIAKWLGDGCMVVSVDQAAGVAAALELRERVAVACAPLGIRLGLASGYALLFEGDDYIGRAVNLAARLCDAADPGEVLLPVENVDGLPPGVLVQPHAPLALQGFPEPVAVVALTGSVPVMPPHLDGGELWTRTPFVA